MEIAVNMGRDAQLVMRLPADHLEDVADILRRERGLIGELVDCSGADASPIRVLIPAHRIHLVAEVGA